MGPMSRSQLRLHLDFGRHGRAEDADSLRECVRSLKPGILVIEGAFMEDEERKAAISEINLRLDKARRTEALKHDLLREIDDGGLFEWPEFTLAQLEIAIAEPSLRIHMVEASSGGESSGDLFVLPFLMNGPGAALSKLYAGEGSEALSLAVKSFKCINDLILIKRNDQILEGFMRLPDEIPLLHPLIAGSVTVVARYGATHAAILPRLRSAGFAAVSDNMPGLEHSSELAIRYSADPTIIITRAEAGAILFDYAFGNAFGETRGSQDQDARDSRLVLASFGGAEGFITSAMRIAKASGSPEQWMARLKEAFEARLAKKDIYSSASQEDGGWTVEG